MTLTQRLTRAGATFILFGFAVALLPQQNEAAAAVATGNCTPPPTHSLVIKDSSGTVSPNYTIGKNSIGVYTSYYDAAKEGTITAANVTTTSGKSATFLNNNSSSVTVNPPNGSNKSGTVSLKATDSARGSQYVATATVSYST